MVLLAVASKEEPGVLVENIEVYSTFPSTPKTRKL
jgi:hypothetical protein